MTFGRISPEDRQAQRAAERAANMAALAKPVKVLRAGTYGQRESVEPIQKRTKAGGRAAELRHKAALAGMGCAVCRRLTPHLPPGPVELHHYRGGGWGKGDYTTLIPLCVEHHRGKTGVHGLGTKGFDKHYGFTQLDLLTQTKTLLEAA